jgi:hypothetical protein
LPRGAKDAAAWQDPGDLLALARYPNVARAQAAANTGLYWQGAKSPQGPMGCGKDRASARESVRNAALAGSLKTTPPKRLNAGSRRGIGRTRTWWCAWCSRASAP